MEHQPVVNQKQTPNAHSGVSPKLKQRHYHVDCTDCGITLLAISFPTGVPDFSVSNVSIVCNGNGTHLFTDDTAACSIVIREDVR